MSSHNAAGCKAPCLKLTMLPLPLPPRMNSKAMSMESRFRWNTQSCRWKCWMAWYWWMHPWMLVGSTVVLFTCFTWCSTSHNSFTVCIPGDWSYQCLQCGNGDVLFSLLQRNSWQSKEVDVLIVDYLHLHLHLGSVLTDYRKVNS
jgi:hypothetical protein